MAKKGEPSVIAFDIGLDSLKAALLSRVGEEIQCLGTMVKPLARGADAAKSLAEALAEAAAKFGAKTKKAVLVTPERMVQYKFFDKPMMPDEQLRQVIDNEMKMTLASAQSNIAASETDKIDYLYASLGQAGNEAARKNHLMSVFVSMAWLKEYTSTFKKAGLILEYSYTLPQTIHELLAMDIADGADDSKLVAVLNIGASANYLTVSRGTTLLLGRSFPFAGDEIDKALTSLSSSSASGETLSRADAENYKKVVGMLSPEEMSAYEDEDCLEIKVSNKIRGLIGQAMQKVRLALEYIKTQEGSPVSKIMLAGGGAAMRGMVDALKEAFSTNDISIIDPFRTVPLSPPAAGEEELPAEQIPLLVQVLGAGVCAMEQHVRMIDIFETVRRERALLMRQFMEKYLPSAALIIAGVLAVTAYYFFWYRAYASKKAELMRSQMMLNETYGPLQKFQPELDEIIKEKAIYEGRIETVKILVSTRVRWSKFLLRVASLISSDVWLESLKATKTGPSSIQVTITGKSSQMTSVSQFQQRLQASGLFTTLDWQGSKHESQSTGFGFAFVGNVATDSADL